MKKLFHISFNKDLEGIWDPMIPAGYNKDDKTELKETDKPRISCSPSIEQCFQAIYPNISKYFEKNNYPYMEFFVYSPKLKGHEKIWTPDYLTKHKLVHDAYITEEHCILDPTMMILVKRVKIANTKKSEDLYYHPFNDSSLPLKYLAPKTIKVVELPLEVSTENININKRETTGEKYNIPKFLKW